MTQEMAPIDQVRAGMMKMRPAFQNALPANISPDKFEAVVLTAIQQTPDLLKNDRKSLYLSALACAKDGLLPDGREAALVAYGDKVQYMPMISGIYKRMYNSGEIASVSAHVVYENDEFDYELGDSEVIRHKPKMMGTRGKPIGAYAIIKTKDGAIYREVMPMEEIERVRMCSRAKDGGPWKGWWSEMARKTVMRRLSKRVPMSAEMHDLLRRDDELYDPNKRPDVEVESDPVAALNAEIKSRKARKPRGASANDETETPALEPPVQEDTPPMPEEAPPTNSDVDDMF